MQNVFLIHFSVASYRRPFPLTYDYLGRRSKILPSPKQLFTHPHTDMYVFVCMCVFEFIESRASPTSFSNNYGEQLKVENKM